MAEILKDLSSIFGVSGNESAVRRLLIKNIQCDDMQIDSMGNIIALKRGRDSSKILAVTAPMDEVGFIVSDITEKGYLKFKSVGNIDPRKIISKRVVTSNGTKGIIGMKAIHLQTRSEREKVVEVKKLFVDIGAEDKADAEKTVKIGDYVTFDTDYAEIGERIKGKALERSGCSQALINLLNGEYPYDFYACFLAQHEVGARGAKIISHRLNVDAVLSLSSVDTTDMFGGKKDGACLDGGVAVNHADRTVIPDKELTDFMVSASMSEGINVQRKVLKPFSSDTGAMQYNSQGARCVSAAIPCRYAKSPVSVMSKKDIGSAEAYARLFLNKIGEVI